MYGPGAYLYRRRGRCSQPRRCRSTRDRGHRAAGRDEGKRLCSNYFRPLARYRVADGRARADREKNLRGPQLHISVSVPEMEEAPRRSGIAGAVAVSIFSHPVVDGNREPKSTLGLCQTSRDRVSRIKCKVAKTDARLTQNQNVDEPFSQFARDTIAAPRKPSVAPRRLDLTGHTIAAAA